MAETNETSETTPKEPLRFEVISAHISEKSDTCDKKHVVYTLLVRHASAVYVTSGPKVAPGTIDRRYTQFLNLHQGLKEEFPDLLASTTFPKKALIGNFDHKLISMRSQEFELFLKLVSDNSVFLTSKSLLSFLQEPELTKAKFLISEQDYEAAVPILENSFIVLNNIYLDRSPAVLLALCRLLGCIYLVPGAEGSEKWADLALHRFEAVSDSDLLVLYVPLLQICTKIYWKIGRDKKVLEQRISDLKKQGIRIENISLLDAATKAEMLIYDNQ